MTRARRELVSLNGTPYYHCTTRCVRRAFLCGTDDATGRCFEHRREWIVRRIKVLASAFAIDVAAYAVMSNHYHGVLRVNREAAAGWTRDEVIERWRSLFDGPPVIKRYLAGGALSAPELALVDEIVDQWRERLMDISWFMRCLNEAIARQANAEDGCRGRFWESRFTCQALLDETALLACMAYVDLNPIRAKMATRLEDSDYTSLQERLGIAPTGSHQEHDEDHGEPCQAKPPAALMAFAESESSSASAQYLPFSFADYLALVDWTGRAVRDDKHGAIDSRLPPILSRLNIQPANWVEAATRVESQFYYAIGPVSSRELCRRLKKNWLHGITACRQLYSAQPA